jgi:hypothetical protein
MAPEAAPVATIIACRMISYKVSIGGIAGACGDAYNLL